MMDMKIAVLFVVFVASARAATECYTCTSASDTGCNDPFSSNSKEACANKKCLKATGESSGQKVTVRGCGNLGGGDCVSGEFEYEGIKMQFSCCDGDNCNGAGLVSVQSKLILLLIATFYMLVM